MIDFGVNPVYAVPVLLIEGTGLTSWNTPAHSRTLRGFLCAKLSSSLCRAVWAAAMLAGSVIRYVNPYSPAPCLTSWCRVYNLNHRSSIMTTQLIPVFAGEIAGVSVQLVDARLLHSFLESAQQFANWIKNRIEEYGFIENQDYLINLLNRSGGTAGKKRTEYHLTLDMAKELSMVERNEKGKQARRYFIECEQHLLKAASNHHEKPEALPNSAAIAIDGNILCEIRNGQIVHSQVLPKGAMVYDPCSAQSVTALVMHYIPAQQLSTLLNATMERMQRIALGKN